MRISLANPVLFTEGSADLLPEVNGFLLGLSKIIQFHKPAGVIIEGHTDDTPIHTERFPSNWDLSSARALNVLRLFQADGVPANIMAAIGYGEYRPKVKFGKNADREAKGVNRRVEILLQLHPAQPKPASALSVEPSDSMTTR